MEEDAVRASAILLAAAALLAPLALSAQPQAPPAAAPASLDALRDAVHADKRGVVERNLELTEEEARRFWPIYDDYQRQLDKIVKRRNRGVLDYVQAEARMTDANARRIASEILTADGEEQKLRERNFKKLSSVLPARKAVRYLQIENKIQTLNRYEVAETIPLVR
jgi:Spy/CpxP family protein refolding chaperone